MSGPKLEVELWQRIAAFEFDPVDAALPFSRRLARDNGWSDAFAQRAVEEYRRFVFLAMVAGHPVTPSDEVDQVWHLHLCYTRSYWEDLCGEVLPRPLHHGPTRGGGAERDKFDDWYRRTLSSYERVFGEPAPSRWWPSPEVRFAPRIWQRIDVGRALVVRRGAVAAAVALLLTLIVPACTDSSEAGPCLWIVGLIALPAALIWWMSKHEHRGGGRRRRGRRGDGGCGGGVGCGASRGDDSGDSGCGGCGGGCGE